MGFDSVEVGMKKGMCWEMELKGVRVRNWVICVRGRMMIVRWVGEFWVGIWGGGVLVRGGMVCVFWCDGWDMGVWLIFESGV